MDTAILNNINKEVRQDDVLWFLGDFAFGIGLTENRIIWLRRQIRCQTIHLIVGNHDKLIVKTPSLRQLFTSVLNYYKGLIDERPFLLTHRPPNVDFVCWENSLWEKTLRENPQTIWLHGHTHNNHHIGPRNLSVELHNYTPVSLNRVLLNLGVKTCV